MDIRTNEEREGMQAMQRREGRADGERERKDVVLTMVLIEEVVLAMVLIEDVLALLTMIEQLECKPPTTKAMEIAKQQSHTVLGVAVECGPTITFTT